MHSGQTIALFLVLVSPSCLCWMNQYDGLLNFHCHQKNAFINYISSRHDNHYEDRQFSIGCKALPSVEQDSVTCQWSGHFSMFDLPSNYGCSNGYINGIYSRHSNHYEDRIFQFKCCSVKGMAITKCSTTWWQNQYDKYFSFTVTGDRVLSGVHSIHDNHYEDRRFKFTTCELKQNE